MQTADRLKFQPPNLKRKGPIILNKIHDIIDSDSTISVINFIFTDICHTTISTYTLLWDNFSIPNTVVSRGTPVFTNKRENQYQRTKIQT